MWLETFIEYVILVWFKLSLFYFKRSRQDNSLHDKSTILVSKLHNKRKFEFIDDSNTFINLISNLHMLLNDENAPVFAISGYKDARLYLALNIKNEQIMALVHSGSTKTYMWDSAAKLSSNFEKTTACMTAANNNTMPVEGIRYVDYTIKNIFGMDALKFHGMTINFQEDTWSLRGGGVELSQSGWLKNFCNYGFNIQRWWFRQFKIFLDVTIKG